MVGDLKGLIYSSARAIEVKSVQAISHLRRGVGLAISALCCARSRKVISRDIVPEGLRA